MDTVPRRYFRNVEKDVDGKVQKFEWVKYDNYHRESYRFIFLRRNSISKLWVVVAVFREVLATSGSAVSFMVIERGMGNDNATLDKLIDDSIDKLQDELDEKRRKVNYMFDKAFENRE